MDRGFFITFEGLDGSGKTTQLRRLATTLEADGRQVVTLRNPGSTVLGDRIRGVLLDSRTEAEMGGIAPTSEMALMFADRAQSLHQVIHPALANGAVVLCDRYTDSSEAYQGAGRGLGSERIRSMHKAVCDEFQPDLTILLLPPLEGSLHRARRRNERSVRLRGTDENRFEREGDDFYRRVYEQYREIARRDAHRVTVIDDPGGVDAIATKVLEAVRKRMSAVEQ